jgi:acetoin:2,6-dichlorophenolindophenol oxidoreductase subunit beta
VFEHKLLYGSKGNRAEKSALSPVGEVPDEEYLIPFGQAVVRRAGHDVTLVATLLMMYRALEAAEVLAGEGISVEVIDPRTLVPFDYRTVYESIARTSRLVIVEEDTRRNGWGAEIAAQAAEDMIYALDAPILRIATYDVPIPFAPVMENYAVPSVDRIIQSIRNLMNR